MKRDEKYYLDRKIRLEVPRIMINDSRINPNNIFRAMSGNEPLQTKDITTGKIFHIYNINSGCVYGTSKVHTHIIKEMGIKNISRYIGYYIHNHRYNIHFIASNKYSILEVNKLLEQKIQEHGSKYFDWIEDVIHDYFVSASGRYYKIYDIYKDIETDELMIVFKGLFGKYEYYIQYYSDFLSGFPYQYAFSSHCSNTNKYPNSQAIRDEISINGGCSKVRACKVKNQKDDLYKLYKSIKEAKYRTFGSSPHINLSDDEIEVLEFYNRLLKGCKQKINKLKEEQLTNGKY